MLSKLKLILSIAVLGVMGVLATNKAEAFTSYKFVATCKYTLPADRARYCTLGTPLWYIGYTTLSSCMTARNAVAAGPIGVNYVVSTCIAY